MSSESLTFRRTVPFSTLSSSLSGLSSPFVLYSVLWSWSLFLIVLSVLGEIRTCSPKNVSTFSISSSVG